VVVGSQFGSQESLATPMFECRAFAAVTRSRSTARIQALLSANIDHNHAAG